MSILRGFIGILVVGAISFAMSAERKSIRWKNLVILLVIMFLLAFVSLQTSAGIIMLDHVSGFFNWLMLQAHAGVDFVFGGIERGDFVFFLDVLMPIVFISALIGILQYTKILPYCAQGIGWLVNKVTGMGEIESYSAIMTAILGQPNAFITIQDQVHKLVPEQMFIMALGGLSSVSATTLASYMQIVEGKFVVVAVTLNIFAVFIVSSLMNPYNPSEYHISLVTQEVEDPEEKETFIAVLGNYISNGFNIALAIAATLIGFIALISFLDNTFINLIHISFTEIIGYVFSPLAFLMGVPTRDVVEAGSIMATKLIGNEFVALNQLTHVIDHIQPKTIAMLSTYVISFSNIGTLGMIIGGVKSISNPQAKMIANFTLKLLFASVLTSMLTASVVGCFY